MNGMTWTKRSGGRRDTPDVPQAEARVEARRADLMMGHAAKTYFALLDAVAAAVDRHDAPLRCRDFGGGTFSAQSFQLVRPADDRSIERILTFTVRDGQSIVMQGSTRIPKGNFGTHEDRTITGPTELIKISGQSSTLMAGGWIRSVEETADYVIRQLLE